MESLGRRFTFGEPGRREFSIEIDPRTVTPDSVHSLVEMGFNRMSLGVQDFNADVQVAVNRLQPEADTMRVVDAARRAGVRQPELRSDLRLAAPDARRLRAYARLRVEGARRIGSPSTRTLTCLGCSRRSSVSGLRSCPARSCDCSCWDLRYRSSPRPVTSTSAWITSRYPTTSSCAPSRTARCRGTSRAIRRARSTTSSDSA